MFIYVIFSTFQVTEITMVAGADAANAYDVALEAIADPTC